MNGDRNPTMGAVEWILLLILSILWGGSFFFAKLGGNALPPLVVVFLRVAIAATTLVAVLVILGRPLPKGARLWAALAQSWLLHASDSVILALAIGAAVFHHDGHACIAVSLDDPRKFPDGLGTPRRSGLVRSRCHASDGTASGIR